MTLPAFAPSGLHVEETVARSSRPEGAAVTAATMAARMMVKRILNMVGKLRVVD